VQPTVLLPWLTRALGALRKAAPHTYGWCRTRWRWATRAATLKAKHGIAVSADTVRRWLHAMGGGWQRATLVAQDDDPHRIDRLVRRRLPHAHWHAHAVMVCADARARHLLPQGGAAWMPQGTQAEGMTPGKHAQHALAGTLHLAPVAPGKVLDGLGPRKNHGVFRDRLTVLNTTYPAPRVTRLSVVVDHSCIDKAQAVEQGLASHPHFPLLRWPTDCPRANPMERAFGDVHAKCTRNHTRQRLRDVVQDVERHVHDNGPWRYSLAQVYDAPESAAAVEHLAVETQAKVAA